MVTSVCSVLHFFVDFVCAWAMFGHFGGNYSYFLTYNFCAFALQMPIGTLMDLLRGRHPRLPTLGALFGIVLTAMGAVLHPALLGLGNALFHVGGGMDVIESDFFGGNKGRKLGVFVAPGALGLYMGTLLGKSCSHWIVLVVLTCVMTILALFLLRQKPAGEMRPVPDNASSNTVALCICCFAVVILRSWIGMAVTFPWKSAVPLAALSVCAAALGKLSGGFLAARFGISRTSTLSLLLAAGCYLLGDIPVFGLAAIFLFNMTMPITLYLLVLRLRSLPGFAFGLLTFGLFLGFLPVYARLELPIDGNLFGAIGSILSGLLLSAAGKAGKCGKVSS